tara:strand:+ start:399 stop:1631 length:1233 start_codon:yes stop_codon:yes gene_type:complete
MNRILKRPMFRMGGSSSGITSGLGRPGYKAGEGPRENDTSKITDAALATMLEGARNRGQFTTTEDIINEARALASANVQTQPLSGRQELARFLIPFGLNFASATPRGDGFSGLLATAAGAAKEPASQLFKSRDKRQQTMTDEQSDLFSAFLKAGLDERRFDKKSELEDFKDSKELLTLYDNTLKKNVIVKAGDVYKNIENYAPAEKDKTGRTFEKLEVANLIEDKMSEIFEIEAKETKTQEDEQTIEKARGVLEYLQGNKNTNEFAKALLKDPEYLNTLRTKIKNKLRNTDKYKGALDETQALQLQQEIDRALDFYIQNNSFPPDLFLAEGGRVAYQMGGGVNPNQQVEMPKIDFETLRARLPKEITDDIVRLIAVSPQALEDFATIQTQQDVNNFNIKYDVELVLPAEA